MATNAVQVETYRPWPKQQEFHSCPAKYRLFGGAAGPGKSRALLEEACLQAWENPGADTLLLRRTFPELQESIIEPFLRYILPQWRAAGATWNASEHIVRWPNRSTTRFGHCQHEDTVYQYQGAEFLFIGVDELTMFTLKMWQFLTSRNRCPISGSFPCMAGATNPGNIGHVWVKSMFIDKRPAPGMERPEQYDPTDYAFIRATLDNNPIYATDAGYLKTLDALPTELYRAFRHGDWELFAGQYFDIWDVRRHTAAAKSVELKPWWPRWVSIDWGFDHPAAVYWHAKDDGERVITYREFHGRQIAEAELGAQIVKLSQGEKINHVFLSPDAFAKKGSANTVAEQIGDVLSPAKLPYPAQADNDRVGGARLMYGLLRADLWLVLDCCPRLIECIPTLIHDSPDHIEDVLKVDQGPGNIGDDPYDAARYGLKSMLSPGYKPVEVRVSERLQAAETRDGKVLDLTSRAIWEQKFRQEESRNNPAIIRPRRWRYNN